MRLITVCTAALLVTTTVSAQTPGQPTPPRVPQPNTQLMYGGSAQDYQTRLTNDVIERERNGGQSGERATLIERLWPLVAEGRCNEARQIARQERDRPVSRRIGEICVEGRPTPLPETPAS